MLRFLGSSFYENLMMALDTMRANKLRSFLTIFGVVVGVITVMLISSIISGINVAVEKQVESFGTRSIFLFKFKRGFTHGRRSQEERMRKALTVDDAAAIKNLASIETAVPILDVSNNPFGAATMVTGKNGKTSTAVKLQGTLPEIEKTTVQILVDGRWFSQSESDANSDVCLIGSSVVDSYFPYESPIGETLEIGGTTFRIIGVLEKREQLFGGGDGGNNDQSNTIYMPMGAALKLKPYADSLFIIAVANEGMLEKAKDEVQDLLRVRRQVEYGQPNNFEMETAASIIDQFQSITAGVAIAMVVISSIGLMIGGIGVMNIMLVSVTERTREIGIRKAVGAKQSDILTQFLIEAATLTGFGGLLGLFLGWLLTLLVKLVLPSYVPWWAPVAGFFASVGIGVIFGLFPAWKAARLDPIESLRYE
ncbi:MAG: ABC transporter permease [Pyrinomonadaceae bacterium]